MRVIGLVFVALLAAGPVAASPPHAAAAIQDADDPFAGGWSFEALEAEAEPLIKAREAGGKLAGDAALEARLAQIPSDPAERSRVLTAYGVRLMAAADREESARAAEAFPYMKRAAAEGRLAFAPDSRMLAMLLSDAANTEFMARGPRTSAEAEAWLDEAFRIRLARLGPRHGETVSSLVYLADIRGLPERHGGDPARIDAVSRLYEPLLAVDPDTIDQDLTPFFVRWMTFLVRVSRPDEACAVLDKMGGVADRLNLRAGYAAFSLGEALSEAGHADRAAPLLHGRSSPASPRDGAAGKPLRCGP